MSESLPLVMMVAVKLSGWARIYGVSRQSAWRWLHAGVLALPARQLATGTILVEVPPAGRSGVALFARVSSGVQRAGLDRRAARLAGHTASMGVAASKVASEVGSGVNGDQAWLLGLLEDPGAATIVVERRDRLARFGVEATRPERRAAPGPAVGVGVGVKALAVSPPAR